MNNYVPKFGQIRTVLPKTTAGYVRRYRAETKEIGRLRGTMARVVLKVVRSWTFMQAEVQLGDVRFRQLCREVGLVPRSPTLSWHRLIARHVDKLLGCAYWLPDNDAALAAATKLNADRLLNLGRGFCNGYRVTASQLKQLAELEHNIGSLSNSEV